MRSLLLVLLLGGSAFGQTMVESAAAAAGGSAGGIAGKKVSDGMTKIFEKVDKQSAKAAKTGAKNNSANNSPQGQAADTSAPILEVGPGVPKSDLSNVPPPPPVHRASVHKPAPPPMILAPVEPPPPVIAPPPPPEMSIDDLRHVTAGMQRDEVLRFGAPSSRITMFEEGHLLEVYRYQTNDTTLGVVRLTDGSVSNVSIR